MLMKNTNISFAKMHLQRSSVKWQPIFPGGDEFTKPFMSTQNDFVRCPWPLWMTSSGQERYNIFDNDRNSLVKLHSLAPGRPRCHFKTAILNLVLLIGIFTSSKDNALRWMPRDLTDDKSTLVQVMAWCRQATSHYQSQCWPRSLSPYVVTRPQWVKRQPCACRYPSTTWCLLFCGTVITKSGSHLYQDQHLKDLILYYSVVPL